MWCCIIFVALYFSSSASTLELTVDVSAAIADVIADMDGEAFRLSPTVMGLDGVRPIAATLGDAVAGF